MLKKFHLLLFICLLGFSISCQTKQASENSPYETENNNQIVKTDVSDKEITQLFIDCGFGENDGKLMELMALPKERVVSVVKNIKDNGIAKGEHGYQPENQVEYLKIKSAYFLWKLGVDSSANEKYIVATAKNKDSNSSFYAFEYLGNIVVEGKKEYLPTFFEDAPKADNAFATNMQGLFVYELENTPQVFLQYLAKEPFKIRKSVYKLVSYTEEMFGEETFESIKSNVRELKENKETKKIAEEFLREVDKKQ